LAEEGGEEKALLPMEIKLEHPAKMTEDNGFPMKASFPILESDTRPVKSAVVIWLRSNARSPMVIRLEAPVKITDVRLLDTKL